MTAKEKLHNFVGLQLDVDVTKHDAKYLKGARNIRITKEDRDSVLLITNERSTLQIFENIFKGAYVGHCSIAEKVVLFTTEPSYFDEELQQTIPQVDHIYIITDLKTQTFEELFQGNLNFNVEHKLETLGLYENENVQKVYWTDSINQPRVININRVKYSDGINPSGYSVKDANTQFDFMATLNLNEVVSTTLKYGQGTFHSGVLQYAFTYYNKYGRESNIFYTTPLMFLDFPERGAKPDENVAISCEIKVENIDTQFDYIRIYSIHRTSYNATPAVRQVVDLDIKNLNIANNTTYMTFTDDGTLGSTVDPSLLLYVGGEELLVGTFGAKDNTLFLGDLSIKRKAIPLFDDANNINYSVIFNQDVQINDDTITEDYIEPIINSPYYTYRKLSNVLPAGFKQGEIYRIGLQFQHKSGKWSDPLFVKDYTIKSHPDVVFNSNNEYVSTKIPTITLSYTGDLSKIIEAGYKKVRAVYVLPSFNTRTILAQGMLCPTVFNVSRRASFAPFAQSSWFMRPNIPENITNSNTTKGGKYNNNYRVETGAWVEFRHNYLLKDQLDRGCEIQGVEKTGPLKSTDYFSDPNEAVKANSNLFAVDQSLLTFHSPEVQFDTNFAFLGNSEWKLRLIGLINFTSNIGSIDIQTSSPPANAGDGFDKRTLGVKNLSNDAARSLVAGLFWHDGTVTREDGDYIIKEDSYKRWMVYPWHTSGSLNNDVIRPEGKGSRLAVLSKKKVANLKFSAFNTYFNMSLPNQPYLYDVSTLQLFDDDKVQLLKVPYNITKSKMETLPYYGNVDTLIGERIKLYVTGDANSFSSQINPDLCHLESLINLVKEQASQPFWWGFEEYLESHPEVKNILTNSENTGSVSTIRMKYVSDKHLVFSLKGNNNLEDNQFEQYILPSVNGCNNQDDSTYSESPYWMKDFVSSQQEKEKEDYLKDYTSLNKVLQTLTQEQAEHLAAENSQYRDENNDLDYNMFNANGYIVQGQRIDNQGNTYSSINSLIGINVTELYYDELQIFIGSSNIVKIRGVVKRYEDDQSISTSNYAITVENSTIALYSNLGDKYYKIYYNQYNPDTNAYDKKITWRGTTKANGMWEEDESDIVGIWKYKIKQDNISNVASDYPYLFLAEFYKEDTDPYKGRKTGSYNGRAYEYIEPDILQSHIWIPGSEPKNITNQGFGQLTMNHGDTWYSRYDCLKTAPFTNADENSIVEIGSFMCESRINLDGRCDKNRGQIENITANTTNFNLMNNVYSQKDNFFNYRVLDEDFYKIDSFKNSITWTKNHILGELVDNWTNLTMASTLDADGINGRVTKIIKFYDSLYCFQDTSISQILFNERVQITPSDNVPIEIANSGRVNGLREITNGVGCTNKWSIISTKNGLYFQDTITNELYTIGQKGTPVSLSGELNCSSWFKKNKVASFYDDDMGEIHFSNYLESFVYSEKLQQFMTFMDYSHLAAMDCFTPNFTFAFTNTANNVNFHILRQGKIGEEDSYNYYFNSQTPYPYSIKFVSNESPDSEKIFTNIDIRANFKNPEDTVIALNKKPFSTIKVSNSYQSTGSVPLIYNKFLPSNLKRKFKIWRIDIPRSQRFDGGFRGNGLQRMRDIYSLIELININPGHSKMELHNLSVKYYI